MLLGSDYLDGVPDHVTRTCCSTSLPWTCYLNMLPDHDPLLPVSRITSISHCSWLAGSFRHGHVSHVSREHVAQRLLFDHVTWPRYLAMLPGLEYVTVNVWSDRNCSVTQAVHGIRSFRCTPHLIRWVHSTIYLGCLDFFFSGVRNGHFLTNPGILDSSGRHNTAQLALHHSGTANRGAEYMPALLACYTFRLIVWTHSAPETSAVLPRSRC